MSKLSRDAEDVKNKLPAVQGMALLPTASLDTLASQLGWTRDRLQAALRELAVR